jgi:hypothetical protein
METKLLKAPIRADQIKWRVLRSMMKDGKITGYVFPYVRAQAVRQILNESFGHDGWTVRYTETTSGAIVCEISVYNGREWVSKEDCGVSRPSMPEKENQIKAGYSDAFKRAARAWGIGDYLSSLGEFRVAMYQDSKRTATEQFHSHKERGQDRPIYCYWEPPRLPEGAAMTVDEWKVVAVESSWQYSEDIQRREMQVPVVAPQAQVAQLTVTHAPSIITPQVDDEPDDHQSDDEESEQEGEYQESQYDEPESYPANTGSDDLVSAIKKNLEQARSLFGASKHQNKLLEMRQYEKQISGIGAKIKEPEQVDNETWKVYCSPSHVKEWINIIKGWGK